MNFESGFGRCSCVLDSTVFNLSSVAYFPVIHYYFYGRPDVGILIGVLRYIRGNESEFIIKLYLCLL